MSNTPPLVREQLEDKLTIWQQRLALLHWDVRIDFDYPTPGDEMAALARINAQANPHHNATIILHRNWSRWPADAWGDEGADKRHADYVLAHELMHCVLRDLDRLALDAMVSMGREAGKLWEGIWEDAMERAVDHLAQAAFHELGPA